ncbi:myb-like protein AA isoform X2 [Battus philenor]|uniref:myb-like protein AA isoform X2 n=1 Tax=Battus philenor TaxID=42288 RepID=UPI0035D02A88
MADSFFGFDTSFPNLNDDEGGGGPSEDEYDALNDETFGQDSDELDWEVEHEQLAEQLESSRRNNSGLDEANLQLEASLSKLVLDEPDSPQGRHSLSSSVWRHDISLPSSLPAPPLKNVCTVEELERQLRQSQTSQQPQNAFPGQNFFQPRYPPVILQRPLGLQAPVPLPYAPQQQMSHNVNQMNQSLNKIIGQSSQMKQLGQTNQLMPNHMVQNQMGQNINQMGQNMNQMSQNNLYMQNNQMSSQFQNNQMGQGMMNQMQHNMHQMSQTNQMLQNQMSQNINQLDQSMNQNMNQMGQNMNQLGQNMNQLGQTMNQMSQNMNHMSQNQMMPNGGQFNPGMNQFPHMMGQPRMIAPPPGMGLPRQNFNPNMNQFNSNFRGPMSSNKGTESQSPLNQNLTMNHLKNPTSTINQNMVKPMMNSPQLNSQMNSQVNSQQMTSHQVTSQNKVQIQNSMKSSSQRNDKSQKTRVYNNTNTNKMMPSQNLAKFLMQNPYPVMPFNNSFHNASHHPMLNNRGTTYNNNQFVNSHPMFSGARPNGSFNNGNRHMVNGDEGAGASEVDEYAGLMTQREKQWLINIQMLQLNTGTPYIHDFYYTVFLERQANKEKEGVKEAHKANQQNHPFYSGVKHEQQPRERHNSHRHNSTSEDGAPRAYVPMQFENSLGKLQCGSVTAPRKIIDVEVVSTEPASARVSRAPSVASTINPAEVPREVKRTKQLLLDIEALYLILLRLEELNDPLAISNALILKEREEKQKQLEAAQKEAQENELEEDTNLFLKNIESVQRRLKQDSPKSESIDKRQVVSLAMCEKPAPAKNLLDEDKDDLLNKMFAGLLHGDRLPQMLTVRKGRALVARFARRTPSTHVRLRAFWSRVLRALPHAARRDDGGLAALAHHYRRYIQNTTGWSAVLESCGILSEAIDPARTHHALTTALTLSCVCAMLEKATMLVNTPEATSSERQWFKFLKSLARALKNTTVTVAKPVQRLPEAKLLHHLKQLESRSTIEILQRGRTTAEFADLTKADVSEQLTKHLC